MPTPEKRSSSRFKVSLAARIVALDNEPVSLDAQTLDIGAGGVRLSTPAEVRIGQKADYIITLSENDPPAKIYCSGRILRCIKRETSWDAVVTMVRYAFIRRDAPNRQYGQDVAAPWRDGKRTGTADLALTDTR
jgi:hypothetical protein